MHQERACAYSGTMKNALAWAVVTLVILVSGCEGNDDTSADQRKRQLCREMNEHMAGLVLQQAKNVPAADRQKHKDNLAAAGDTAMDACLVRSEESIRCVMQANNLETTSRCID